MVAVKEKTKVKTGTVVKIGVDVARVLQMLPNNVLPAYQPTEINYDGKKYVLREPLQCEVKWEQGENESYYRVDYTPFEVYASGNTPQEAIEWFNFKFADKYEYLNELAQPHGRGLADRLENIRQQMKHMIVSTLSIDTPQPKAQHPFIQTGYGSTQK